MAIKVADAYIPIMLDTSEIDSQLADIEKRIANIQNQAQTATNAASGASAALASVSASAQSMGGASSGGTYGSGGLFGGGGGGTQIHSFWDMTGGAVVDQVRNQRGPLEAIGNMASMVRDNVVSAVTLSRKHGSNVIGAAKEGIGAALMGGTVEGIDEHKSELSDAMRNAVDEAIKAGQDEAEIKSPSARAGRELGAPIMLGVENAVRAGGANVANAMVNTIDFAFQKSVNELFGGQFLNRGANIVANPGGNFSGVGAYIDEFGNAVNASFAAGDPQSFGQSSRVLASNLPDKVRDFGQNLLSGAVGSVLPGFAAGPVSDMLGTMLGTKPILTAEQAMSASVSADQGGLSDSPFTGGQFVFNNSFGSAGNFTDTERDVQLGILQSMRRLGVSF